MKKSIRGMYLFALMVCLTLTFGVRAQAREADTIKTGIFAGDIELSGMNRQEATEAVEAYVDGLKGVEFTLVAAADNEVTVTAGELGLSWDNPELIDEALAVGIQGNVIERYKLLKDLEQDNLILPVKLTFSLQAISDILLEKCTPFDQEAEDATLVRENGAFQVIGGQIGYALDVETSVDKVKEVLMPEWDCQPHTIQLDVEVVEPKGKAEDLAQVKDLLGSYTTDYGTDNNGRGANVIRGCELINGTLLYPGEEYSASEGMAPYTVDNGYYMAGTYVGGRVVDGLGGGVCQVSTTLYNAILLAELEVTDRYNHSMMVTYVEPSADAAIADSSGKDLKFVNNQDYPIYIEGIAGNGKITFHIYGKETRPSNRQVRYESKVLQVINPTNVIVASDSLPLGYISTGSAFIGYKAQLWKVVLVDGVEVERTQVNSSSYKMVPRETVVGTATEDPAAHEEIMAAIGTNSVDHVKNVIALLTSQPAEGGGEPAAPSEPEAPSQPEAPSEPEPTSQPEVPSDPAAGQPEAGGEAQTGGEPAPDSQPAADGGTVG